MNRTNCMLLGGALLLHALMALSGCGLSKPYSAKQLYAIDVGTPPSAAPASPDTTLRILRVRVAEPFSSREFHYLVGSNEFQQDYYANFVADPDRLVAAEILDWMSTAGLYATVVDSSSSVNADHSLQCVVTQLYGDMSDPAVSPRAVFQARFFLLDETGVDAKVLFTRDYREVEQVDGTGTEELTQAWGRALKKILERLTSDLRSVPSADTPS